MIRGAEGFGGLWEDEGRRMGLRLGRSGGAYDGLLTERRSHVIFNPCRASLTYG